MQQQMILCVDSDPSTSELLAASGYSVVAATTARDAINTADRASLIIMELELPDMGGLALLRRLKDSPATRHIPVIVLTARREAPVRVVALELGADDCLTKPFFIEVLVARIRTLLRRMAKCGLPVILVNGPLTVDREKQEAFLHGERLPLETREFALLRELIENLGQPLSSEYLVTQIWGFDYFADPYAVHHQCRRLRAKLGAYGDLIRVIRRDEFIMDAYPAGCVAEPCSLVNPVN
ncbi:MAG: response regulator transcription factor [bacterium]